LIPNTEISNKYVKKKKQNRNFMLVFVFFLFPKIVHIAFERPAKFLFLFYSFMEFVGNSNENSSFGTEENQPFE